MTSPTFRRLGEVIEVKHGFAFDGAYFCDSGPYRLLTPGNFAEAGGFVDRGDKQKYYDGPVPKDFVLSPGSLLVAMTEQAEGLLGSSALVPSEGKPCLHNQRLGLVRPLPSADVDVRFLYYLFNTSDVRRQIRATASGAKVRHTAPSRITAVVAYVPELPVQRRIASILGAYDDLIEVNRRRIAVLEEMARRLFEEWFVHLRFPGHAALSTKQVGDDLVPDGWVVQSIGETFGLLGGGTPSKGEPEFWVPGEVEWYTPSDLTGAKTVFMDHSGLRISRVGLQRSSAHLFPPYSVMMTSRATIGAIAVNTTAASTNQGFITCLPNDRVPLAFMYHWLHWKAPVFIAHGTGATFKEITKGVFRRLPIVVPPGQITAEFERRCRPMLDTLLVLERSQRRLAESRDLLLPRLISGNLPIAAAERALEAIA